MNKHVLLIHGTWQTPLFWDQTIPELEARGYTVHAPALRYHDLPLHEGAKKIGPLSLLDYTDDLVKYAESLDSPPLIIGHSLGALIAQLVAARTHNQGVIAASPAPAAGIFALYPNVVITFIGYFLKVRPWTKPMMPDWKKYAFAGASRQPEHEAKTRFAGLVAESGRAYCEMVFYFLDKRSAARVNYKAITTPVLALAAQYDNIINPSIPKTTASKFERGSYEEVADADHMMFFGAALPNALKKIDSWVSDENIFA